MFHDTTVIENGIAVVDKSNTCNENGLAIKSAVFFLFWPEKLDVIF